MSDKKKAGRPSKYTPELLEKANEYVENWQASGRVIPSIVGLAIHCGISKALVYEWIKDEDKRPFLDVYARVESIQEMELIDKGLNREHDASLSKMLLAKHGYSDKQTLDVDAKVSVKMIGMDEL